jgi:hypothetical protein
VVDRVRLESECSRKVTRGSNPLVSAESNPSSKIGLPFVYARGVAGVRERESKVAKHEV